MTGVGLVRVNVFVIENDVVCFVEPGSVGKDTSVNGEQSAAASQTVWSEGGHVPDILAQPQNEWK